MDEQQGNDAQGIEAERYGAFQQEHPFSPSHEKRLAKRLFRSRPDDEAQDEGAEGEAVLPQVYPQHSCGQEHPDVEEGVAGGEGSEQGQGEDGGTR